MIEVVQAFDRAPIATTRRRWIAFLSFMGSSRSWLASCVNHGSLAFRPCEVEQPAPQKKKRDRGMEPPLRDGLARHKDHDSTIGNV
jgi:hypothetical protein